MSKWLKQVTDMIFDYGSAASLTLGMGADAAGIGIGPIPSTWIGVLLGVLTLAAKAHSNATDRK